MSECIFLDRYYNQLWFTLRLVACFLWCTLKQFFVRKASLCTRASSHFRISEKHQVTRCSKLLISWRNRRFPQKALAGSRTSDLPGKVPSVLTTRLPHLSTNFTKIYWFYSYWLNYEIALKFAEILAISLLSILHIILFHFLNVFGDGLKNIISAPPWNWPWMELLDNFESQNCLNFGHCIKSFWRESNLQTSNA